MKFFAPILLLSLLVTCTTYDSALVYHKNFNHGHHPLLRFNGYYDDTTANNNIDLFYPGVKPVFFYSEGSSFSTDNSTVRGSALIQQIETNRLKGSWGNYLIKGDSITLEKFQLIKSNYERIILKGIVSENKIRWTSRKDHNEVFKPVDYSIYFKPFSAKPDSLRNFIRTKEKYNK
ncbi:MAG: hypothetical protein M3R17_20300 [Bacteroidota bacterium]|nr:hypothetical protein [Bacteroidota bacterium]